MNESTTAKWMNAKQVYDVYGIGRAALGQLVLEGRITKRTIENEMAVVNLYAVADIERLINGSDNEASR